MEQLLGPSEPGAGHPVAIAQEASGAASSAAGSAAGSAGAIDLLRPTSREFHEVYEGITEREFAEWRSKFETRIEQLETRSNLVTTGTVLHPAVRVDPELYPAARGMI